MMTDTMISEENTVTDILAVLDQAPPGKSVCGEGEYYAALDTMLREIAANPDIQRMVDVAGQLNDPAKRGAATATLEQLLSDHFKAEIRILMWLRFPAIMKSSANVQLKDPINLTIKGNHFEFNHMVSIGLALPADLRQLLNPREIIASLLAQVGYMGAYYSGFERLFSMVQYLQYAAGSSIFEKYGNQLESSYRSNNLSQATFLGKLMGLGFTNEESTGFGQARVDAMRQMAKTAMAIPIRAIQTAISGRMFSVTAGTRETTGNNIASFYGFGDDYISVLRVKSTLEVSANMRYAETSRKPFDIRMMETLVDMTRSITNLATGNLTGVVNEVNAAAERVRFLEQELELMKRKGEFTPADEEYMVNEIAMARDRAAGLAKLYAEGKDSGVAGIRNTLRKLENGGVNLANTVFQSGRAKTVISADTAEEDESASSRVF